MSKESWEPSHIDIYNLIQIFYWRIKFEHQQRAEISRKPEQNAPFGADLNIIILVDKTSWFLCPSL